MPRGESVLRRVCEGVFVMPTDEFVSLCCPRIDFEWVAGGLPHAPSDPAQLHRLMLRVAEPWHVAVSIDHLTIDGDVGMVARTSFFEHRAGAHPSFAVPILGVLTLEDGRVRRWREYFDRAGFPLLR